MHVCMYASLWKFNAKNSEQTIFEHWSNLALLISNIIY